MTLEAGAGTSRTRSCAGAILAGGRSTRFGGVAKGLERVGGRRIIDRVADALREACDDLVLVANAEEATDWLPDVRVVRDLRAGAGALGGLHAALSATVDAVLVLSWDSPFVPGALLRALREAGENHDADAVVPRSESPWGFEPLCAWYGPRCRATIEQSIDAGELQAGGWQVKVHTRRFDARAWGDPTHLFLNVNSAEDLARAQELLSVPDR